MTTWAKPAKPTFEAILEDLPPGVTEVYLHPVEDGPELRAYDPHAAQIRIDDRACLLDPAFKARIAELGIVLIDFAPLRDLQRARG